MDGHVVQILDCSGCPRSYTLRATPANVRQRLYCKACGKPLCRLRIEARGPRRQQFGQLRRALKQAGR